MKEHPLIAKLTDHDHLSRVARQSNQDQINTYQGYGSMPDQSEEWEERFDTEFPEVLKFLPDNEDNTYKFLFQKQNKELKRFISQEIQLAYDCGFKEGVDDLFFSCAGDEDCVDTLNYLRELRK